MVDTGTHQVLTTLDPSRSATVDGAVCRAGRDIVAQLSDGRLVRYDGQGRHGTVLSRFTEPIGVVAASPDGRRLAVGNGTTLDLLDSSGAVLKSLDESSIVQAVAFSPRVTSSPRVRPKARSRSPTPRPASRS